MKTQAAPFIRFFATILFMVSTAVATETIDWDSTIIIDVRSRSEWNASRLEGAIWIPWTQIEQGVKDYNLSPNQHLAFYCARGVRADRAIRRLARLGFTNTTNLISLSKASEVSGRQIEK